MAELKNDWREDDMVGSNDPVAMARSQLMAFESWNNSDDESWRTDHQEAMQCFGLESRLEVALAVFRALTAVRHLMVKKMIHQTESDETQSYEELRLLHTKWLTILQGELPSLDKAEARFDLVKGGDEFRAMVGETERVLATWAMPAKAVSPHRQVWEVTEDEARELQSLMTAPAGSPGTHNRKLQPMKAGDPALLQ